jgi:hypothetical protein
MSGSQAGTEKTSRSHTIRFGAWFRSASRSAIGNCSAVLLWRWLSDREFATELVESEGPSTVPSGRSATAARPRSAQPLATGRRRMIDRIRRPGVAPRRGDRAREARRASCGDRARHTVRPTSRLPRRRRWGVDPIAPALAFAHTERCSLDAGIPVAPANGSPSEGALSSGVGGTPRRRMSCRLPMEGGWDGAGSAAAPRRRRGARRAHPCRRRVPRRALVRPTRRRPSETTARRQGRPSSSPSSPPPRRSPESRARMRERLFYAMLFVAGYYLVS